MQVLAQEPKTLLHIKKNEGELRITTRFRRRNYSAIGTMFFGACLMLGIGVKTIPSQYYWFHIVWSSLIGLVFLLLGLGELRQPKQSVWVVNTRDRHLEHNGKVVTCFDEMRVVWAAQKSDRRELCDVLGLTVHQNRRVSDIVLDRAPVKEGGLAEFEHTVRLIAQHANIRCKKREGTAST